MTGPSASGPEVRALAAEALESLADTRRNLLHGVDLSGAPEGRSAARAAGPSEAAALAIDEPVYDRTMTDDVQGNLVPGFNKDHQHFLFLRFGATEGTRAWLRWLGSRLTTMTEVVGFRREFRAQRLRLGVPEPGMTATWLSVAFSSPALSTLLGPDEAARLRAESFHQGLAERSAYLGDPTDPALPGHRDHWLVGGPDREADALVVVAADLVEDLAPAVGEVLDAAAQHGLTLLFDQRGDNLPGNLQGHEHFGFKDGVSQPGVRGRLGDAAQDHLTPRFLAHDDPHAELFAKPGQPLVWPGQFLLGEPRQDPQDPRLPAPAADVPPWARRGSFVVCRRLDQDVVAFWEHAADNARALAMSPVRFASLLVGRWPSGTPVSRSPFADDADVAGDEFAVNHFLFEDDTRPSRLRPLPGYDGDRHAAAEADVFGRVCPHVAHIRKVNPRDSGTDFGAPADTLARLMLRRGIPYGPPLAGVRDPGPELVAADRGLMFVAVMASIEDQFEFVTRRWANSAVQPGVGGVDPVIGQQDRAGDRTRTYRLPAGDGTRTFTARHDFVTPTGGGYFFAPSISTVRGALAAGPAGQRPPRTDSTARA